MQKEHRVHGFISDGYGKRYLIFWLYFVLGDLKGANAYLRWYEKTFSDDIGEPIQKLCTAILLHRSDKQQKAKYLLADLMLSNLYTIPRLLGEKCERFKIECSSNFEGAEYVEEIPNKILSAITDEDRAWIRELHESFEFQRYKKQYIELRQRLDKTHSVENRSPIVDELGLILKDLKNGCS
ncbi:MAG: hypothetical protein RQ736_08105 [Thiogranum sp.]|nr:hypothetical protein [Thiogranum sp.]